MDSNRVLSPVTATTIDGETMISCCESWRFYVVAPALLLAGMACTSEPTGYEADGGEKRDVDFEDNDADTDADTNDKDVEVGSATDTSLDTGSDTSLDTGSDAHEDADDSWPPPCDERVPTHLTRATDECDWDRKGSADCTTWEGLFQREFGLTKSIQTRFYQLPNQYLALEFDSGDYPVDANGRIGGETPQYGVETGEVLWTISTCPGDFYAEAISAEMEGNCYRRGNAATVMHWEGEEVGLDTRCTLEQNTTYYLNLLYTDSEAETSPDELNWACAGDPDQTCGRALTISDHQ